MLHPVMVLHLWIFMLVCSGSSRLLKQSICAYKFECNSGYMYIYIHTYVGIYVWTIILAIRELCSTCYSIGPMLNYFALRGCCIYIYFSILPVYAAVTIAKVYLGVLKYFLFMLEVCKCFMDCMHIHFSNYEKSGLKIGVFRFLGHFECIFSWLLIIYILCLL